MLSWGTIVGGRYELIESLGEGTFGEVWMAVDRTLDDRAVAVKILKAEYLGNADIVARFEGEAGALAKLSHANVVAIFDRGESNGFRYLVMELVAGRSLESWLQEHEQAARVPDIATALDLFDQICAGVEAAHDVRAPQAIVHRDLKPANVMLASDKKGRLVAKVLDFGIARLGARQRSKSGALMGTLIYMAPEQGLGQASRIGAWTDVFSLGAILIELLTLRRAPDDDRTWWAAVAVDRIDLAVTLRSLRADVPGSLWDVAVKAMSLEPSARYQDAGELREAARMVAVISQPAMPIGPPGVAGSVAELSFPSRGAALEKRTAYAQVGPTGTEKASPAGLPIGNKTERAAATGKEPAATGWVAAGVSVAAVVLLLSVAMKIDSWTTSSVEASGNRDASSSDATIASVPVAATSSTSPTGSGECPGAGMVDIPADTFSMGSPAGEGERDEHPIRLRVKMSAFAIDRTDVTVQAYGKCHDLDSNTCPAPDTGGNCNWKVEGRECHPINCISWTAADAYCRRLHLRLPTEAEWEYAAKGSDDPARKYPWKEGDPSNQLCWNGAGNDLGKGNRNSTCVVGSFPAGASRFGVLDMAGNIWQWTADWYAPSYDASQTRDPIGSAKTDARVVRGGSWYSDVPSSVRVTSRDRVSASGRNGNVGFRCARGLEPKPPPKQSPAQDPNDIYGP